MTVRIAAGVKLPIVGAYIGHYTLHPPSLPPSHVHKYRDTGFQKKKLLSAPYQYTLVVVSNYSQTYVCLKLQMMSYARRWVEFLISPKFSSVYVFAYSIITLVPPPTHAHIHVWYTWPCVCTSEYISVAPFPNPIPSFSMLHVLILRSLGGHVGRARVCV